MKTRRRSVGSPNLNAGSTSHSASNPHSARSPRTTPIPRLSNAATFSTTTNRGRSSRMIRAYSFQSPLRSPSMPTRFPASLMSWHGKPPQRTSTRSRLAAPHSRTSRKRRTRGQCFSSTWIASSLISICHLHCIPARSNPRSKPPPPANKLPNVSGSFVMRPSRSHLRSAVGVGWSYGFGECGADRFTLRRMRPFFAGLLLARASQRANVVMGFD